MTREESYKSDESELRAYAAPVGDVFHLALQGNHEVSIQHSVMGGAPCIVNTRIPVYMVLEAIEEHGSIDAAVEKSYPQISREQAEAALRFARIVVECPRDI